MANIKTRSGWLRLESGEAAFPGAQLLNDAASPLAILPNIREILVNDDSGGPNGLDLLLPSATGSGREILVTWFGPSDNGWGVDFIPQDGESLQWGNMGETVGPAELNIRSDGNLGQSYTLRDIGAGLWQAILPAAEAQNDADNANQQAGQANYRAQNGPMDVTTLANGSTPGFIATTVTTLTYRVDGRVLTKAATDDVWDLSGVNPDNGAGEFRAIGLDLDAAGVGHIDDSAPSADSENSALGNMNQPGQPDRARVGVYVGGPNCDWDDAGGLAAQGNFFLGWPSSIP